MERRGGKGGRGGEINNIRKSFIRGTCKVKKIGN
jgi:hypothetical protein